VGVYDAQPFRVLLTALRTGSILPTVSPTTIGRGRPARRMTISRRGCPAR